MFIYTVWYNPKLDKIAEVREYSFINMFFTGDIIEYVSEPGDNPEYDCWYYIGEL